ncbi:unnamed protein product [Cuscuta epithymum]|uniref:Uncharacterized protein n=1 Tax=Cuscuta epithymum TaxID=186058 RepID=A0AAV0EMT2_9ASTE|nr:unnamed protein product [Cuscuta epithymum]
MRLYPVGYIKMIFWEFLRRKSPDRVSSLTRSGTQVLNPIRTPKISHFPQIPPQIQTFSLKTPPFPNLISSITPSLLTQIHPNHHQNTPLTLLYNRTLKIFISPHIYTKFRSNQGNNSRLRGCLFQPGDDGDEH